MLKTQPQDSNWKKWIKNSPMAAPLTVARMVTAGYCGYPENWGQEDETTKNILDTVRETGFYVYEDYYTPEQCALLRSEIDRVLAEYKDQTSFDDLIGDARMFGAEKVSEAIRDYNQDSFLQKLSDLYHGQHAPAPFTMAARLEPNKINKDTDHGWHRDSLRRQFKSIIYLSDVTIDNGPYQYIANSNHMGRIFIDGLTGKIPYMSPAVSPESAQRIIAREPQRLKTVLGRAGTVILTDTTGIHRGSTIKSGHRYALTNYYMFPDHIGPWMNDYFGPLAYRKDEK